MYTPFTAPCTLTYTDGSSAALTLVPDTPHVSVGGETYFQNAANLSYRTKRDPATGALKTLWRNAPPDDPSTGDHNGTPFTISV